MRFPLIIPCESRATMVAYREGCTLEDFLDAMWRRREDENPRDAKSKGKWPFVRLADICNVTPMKKRKP